MKNNKAHERLRYSLRQALSLSYLIPTNNCFDLDSPISHRLWYTSLVERFFPIRTSLSQRDKSMYKVSTNFVLSREHFQHVWYTCLFGCLLMYGIICQTLFKASFLLQASPSLFVAFPSSSVVVRFVIVGLRALSPIALSRNLSTVSVRSD